MSQCIVPDTNEPQVAMAAIAYQIVDGQAGWSDPAGTVPARLKLFVEAYHVLAALITEDGAVAKNRISAMKE